MDRQARKLANRSNPDERSLDSFLIFELSYKLIQVFSVSGLFIFAFDNSEEEMEEANPVEAHDSDYDPTKEAKKEVMCICTKCVFK